MMASLSLKVLAAMLVVEPSIAVAQNETNGATAMSESCSRAGQQSDFLEWQQSYYLEMSFVQDAMRRWAKKGGEPIERLPKTRNVQLMYFPHKVCVQFAFKDPSVGGIPIYCYAVKENQGNSGFVLVEEYSDRE